MMLRLECVLQHLPPSACTANLHWSACHIFQQESRRGSVAKDNELCIERAVQDGKGEMRNRVSFRPEIMCANANLLSCALAALRHQQADSLRDFDGLCPGFRAKLLSGRSYDSEDPSTGTQLLHKGRAPHRPEQAVLLQQVRTYVHLRSEPLTAFQPSSSITHSQILVHTQLHKGGEELITSRMHARSRSRISYYVLLQLQGPRGGALSRIARVEHYLRVLPAQAHEDAAALRLAV